MRRNFVKRNGLPWLTSKDMKHFVRTVLNDSGMPKVERHYWQGHAFNPADMDERYRDRPPDETLEVERRRLAHGVLGTFLRMDPTEFALPLEVRELWTRIVSGDLDSLEAAQALTELARTARQKARAAEIVRP